MQLLVVDRENLTIEDLLQKYLGVWNEEYIRACFYGRWLIQLVGFYPWWLVVVVCVS